MNTKQMTIEELTRHVQGRVLSIIDEGVVQDERYAQAGLLRNSFTVAVRHDETDTLFANLRQGLPTMKRGHYRIETFVVQTGDEDSRIVDVTLSPSGDGDAGLPIRDGDLFMIVDGRQI